MSDAVAWALHRARTHTLALVSDLPENTVCLQSGPGEHHPAWILGHLLVADTYLLSLLEVEALPPDFPDLLRRFGPGAVPTPSPDRYEPKGVLAGGLARTHSLRLDAVRRMSAEGLARPMPDATLAKAQPTIGHHLQALVFHEGYHGGELASWRRAHGLPPVPWAFAAAEDGMA